MSPIRIIILLVAAGAAVAAAFLMRNMAQVPEPVAAALPMIQQEVQREPTVKVLVARRDMGRGELLVEADMVWTDWPEKVLNPSFYNERDYPDAMTMLSGSAVRMEIFENEPITTQRLVIKGSTGYMAALIGPDMRAVAVEVSPETASGGFILPDDRVDVMVTYEIELPGENSQQSAAVTQTILQNVRVLAIDQFFRQLETGAYTPGTVATLELSLDDAEILELADRTGEISLVLRSFSDAARDGDAVVSVADTFLSTASPTSRSSGTVTIVRNGKAQTTYAGGGN